MREYVPDGYDKFHCIADQCKHTCCAGWDIEVDPETADWYRSLSGEPGDRLRSALREGNYFPLDDQGRCPFLNRQGLCELILLLGEESLCQICRDHPRYITEFNDRTETSLGLCCEAAGRLLLNRKEPAWLRCVWDDGKDEPLDPLEKEMLSEREKVFKIIQDRSLPFSERTAALIRRYHLMNFDTIANRLPTLLKMFEIMDPDWITLLSCQEKPVPVDDLHQEQLAFSLVLRHFPRMLEGYSAGETMMFILQMQELILRHVYSSDPEALVQTARLFSAEIEYSDENPEMILRYLRDQTRIPSVFEQRVYAELRKIPRGKVTTYGVIAKRIGKPGAARAVGQALHRNPDPVGSPCYRVVNSRGKVADHFGLGGGKAQVRLLEQDGIILDNGYVNLKIYQAWPDE